MRDIIVILEERSCPYPRRTQCIMFVPQKALNNRHLTKALYRQVMDRKWRRLEEEEAREGPERAIIAYGVPLSRVTSFKYLGIVLVEEDDDWPEVVRNFCCSRQEWARMDRVMIREGLYARTLGQIYLALVQSVLIYRSEIWVLNPRMQRVLGGFHHRVAHRLTGQKPRKGRDGGWVNPPLEDAMAEVGLHKVETYVSRRHKNVAQYIATRTIMDPCLAAKRRPGTRVAMWWR